MIAQGRALYHILLNILWYKSPSILVPCFFPPLCLEARQPSAKFPWKFDPGPIPCTLPFIKVYVHLSYPSVHLHVPGCIPVHLFRLSTSTTPNHEHMLTISSMGNKSLDLPVSQVEPTHKEIVFCKH